MRAALLLALAALAGGCASVAPYQRGYLARPDMALEPSPGVAKGLDKTFAAREAAFGAPSVGGGGCGCN